MKKEIFTPKAPAVIGPYSQAVVIGDLVFCSGNIGIDPKTNNIVDGGIKKQTEQVFRNIKEVLKAAGLGFEDVVKVTVYLQNMADYTAMNDIYSTYFAKPYPARAALEVAKLPKNALVEIECIAVINVDDKEFCGNYCRK